MKIGLLSDTHGFLDERVFEYFKDCDEVWHAGDIGDWELLEQLEDFKPLRAVYGNIDGGKLRQELPEDLFFEVEGLKVWMTHIGGYPGKYAARVRNILKSQGAPDLFICGHSHILKVMADPKFGNMLCMNPGAAGRHGFHKVRTLLRFEVNAGRPEKLEVIELGARSALK
ncbi:metallophosphoesterase [Persicobacter sp. CCB-QB2]|uniref:metallophosphoesterase family protein n=1 Tax=Persicobacter sp. CCB-QB2 TaxID=1561025 RepID=UPI0006A9AC54|nr:metallophosphoesterase family protein [Persicobacter sp. CCB-QB2]